jgi:hypothetical protein
MTQCSPDRLSRWLGTALPDFLRLADLWQSLGCPTSGFWRETGVWVNRIRDGSCGNGDSSNRSNSAQVQNSLHDCDLKKIPFKLAVRPAALATAHQSLPGKKTKLWNLRKWLYPISDLEWWGIAFRWMINPNRPNAPYKLSRLTRIVFHLDPGSYYVWPHPRIETHPAWKNVGTVVARLLVTFRNPHLHPRTIEFCDTKTSGKTLVELEGRRDAEAAWRYRMFCSYGDKWPDDQKGRRSWLACLLSKVASKSTGN